MCECNEGYEETPDGKECIDSDECNYVLQCGFEDAVSRCVNIEGSYRCLCNAGFKLDHNRKCDDINECEIAGNAVCRNGDCENHRGTFQCLCHPGFELSEDNRNCIDIDECYNEANPYGTPCGNGICINTNGGYTCECEAGYEFDDGTCVNINECENTDGPDGVCKNGFCDDQDGGFKCSCPHGYAPTNDGSDCYDTRIGQCHLDSRTCQSANPLSKEVSKSTCCCQCSEQGSSWVYEDQCTTCPREGTEEFNKVCPNGCGSTTTPGTNHPKDIDECSLLEDCCNNGKCINTDGSYICECPNGYHLDSDGHTCVDKDECSTMLNPCGSGKCSNTEGGFSCICDDGLFQGPDGKCVGMSHRK